MRSYIYTLMWFTTLFVTGCKNNNAQQSQFSNTSATSVTEPKVHYGADVTDYDGNTYHTIIIGNQTWLAQNLKVTHYNNGDKIPLIVNNKAWGAQTSGACCNYNNDERNINTLGMLYNWHAITDKRRLAPKGWHVPTDKEWKTMIDFLGGNAVAGSKLSIAANKHWEVPNNTATNITGFNGLPAGNRNNNGVYDNKGFSATWWTATGEPQADFATNYSIFNNKMELKSNVDDRVCGFSIRCVKD